MNYPFVILMEFNRENSISSLNIQENEYHRSSQAIKKIIERSKISNIDFFFFLSKSQKYSTRKNKKTAKDGERKAFITFRLGKRPFEASWPPPFTFRIGATETRHRLTSISIKCQWKKVQSYRFTYIDNIEGMAAKYRINSSDSIMRIYLHAPR